MYWNSENNCEEIEFLLNKQDLTLTELLDSENILQECKAQNKNLVQYILKPEIIDELIHLIVTEPPITIEESLRFKYPNIACEILTSYIPTLKSRIVSKISTLESLYNFLEQDPPLNPLLTSFFTKTFGMLFAKANEEDWFSYQCICIQVIDFIKSKYGFLNTIYKHIGTPVVMDFLCSIITNVQGEIRNDLFEWFNQQQLIQNLIKLLGQDNQSNKHNNIAQFISDLIKTGRTNRQNDLQELGSADNSIYCDSLLKLLEDETITELLLNIMMENNQKDSCIESGIIIILTLLENPIKNEPVSDKALQHLMDVERAHHQRIVENILKTIVPKIKDFHLLLINPPAKPDILTTITLLSPPFGNIRLQVCTLLTVLIETGNRGIINAICDTEFFNTLLKLFKQYCWNNILHNQVKKCCKYACLSFDEIDGGLIPSVLQTHIIVDCKIVPKLIECWMHNNEIQFKNKRPRLAYMGHLIEIFDLLLSSAISSDKYRALIESNLSDDELKNWQMLTDLNDGEIIKEIKIQQQYLANLDPADNTESFETNINNFPEEAYTDNVESMHNTIDDDSNDYSSELFEEACNDRDSSAFNMDMEPCNLRAEIWEDPNMQQFMKKVVEDVDCVIREDAKKIQDSEFYGYNGIHNQQSQANLIHNLKRYVVKVLEEELQMKENETVLKYNNNDNNDNNITNNNDGYNLVVDDVDEDDTGDDNRREKIPNSDNININISENLYKKASVKLLTMSKFNFINYKDFQDKTDSNEKTLSIPDDTNNILDLIGIYSENIKAKIQEEIKNKMICLKINAVGSVKCDKSILVINAQFLCGKLIVVRTLGMIELTKGHTDDTFKNEIVNILNEYNISLEQIYSTVTDNGSNVLEPIEITQNEIDLLSEKQEVWRLNSTVFEMYTIGERLLEPTLKSIRCASYTLELVVTDVLKTDDLCVHIEEARLFVKKLRDQPYSFTFLVAGKKLLFLDIVTRWISTYEMIDRIILDKTFIEDLIKNDYNFNLSSQFWIRLEDFKTAFYPIFVATKQLQVEHLTMGEFFKIWLECQLELKSMINNRYSELLLNAMKNRKVNLFKSDEFLAAIYMDARFNYDGSEYFTDVLKANAKIHLINTWRTMQTMANRSSTLCVPTLTPPQSPQPPPPTSSKLEAFLRQKEIDDNQLRCGGNDISLNFENKIDMLCHCKRLNADYDILEYWENRKYTEPELYSLAQIVLAVPSSQLTVREAFNALALVLTHSRTHLNRTILNNILIIQLNDELYTAIT